MRKIASMKKEDATPKVVLASNSQSAIKALAGKSLYQVGSEFDLSDEDIDFVNTSDGRGGKILNLCVVLDGTETLVSFSRNFPMDRLNDADYLLDCEFRLSHKSVKEDDGITPKTDDNGNVILDETQPYLSFGKPSGIVIIDREAAFAEPKAATKAGGATGGRKGR